MIIKNANLIIDENTSKTKAAIEIVNGKIERVMDNYSGPADFDLKGNKVFPGFIDVHIHGAMNHDFISGTRESLEVVSENLIKDGVTAFLASLTVLSPSDTLKALAGLSNNENLPYSKNLGIHLEGPYISKYYKALMDERYIRKPNIQEMSEMLKAAKNKVKTMTLACEYEENKTFIPYLCKNNIVAMIGHSNGTSQDVEKCHQYGAKGFTHLYNAMSQHLHRNPGVVTGAFLFSDMYCEMIIDGFHTDIDIIRATYKILTSKRIIMITDAMLAKGMPDGSYTFSNLNCIKKGKNVTVKETGRRAGSAISIIDSIKLLKKIVHVSDNEILEMTSLNPAKLLNISDLGKITKGYKADLTVLDDNYKVKMVFVDGKIKYQA